MTVTINGDEREFSREMSLAELMDELSMKPDRVAVELNHAIVQRTKWAETELHDGDRLEIVHFVGGGIIAPGKAESAASPDGQRGER